MCECNLPCLLCQAHTYAGLAVCACVVCVQGERSWPARVLAAGKGQVPLRLSYFHFHVTRGCCVGNGLLELHEWRAHQLHDPANQSTSSGMWGTISTPSQKPPNSQATGADASKVLTYIVTEAPPHSANLAAKKQPTPTKLWTPPVAPHHCWCQHNTRRRATTTTNTTALECSAPGTHHHANTGCPPTTTRSQHQHSRHLNTIISGLFSFGRASVRCTQFNVS